MSLEPINLADKLALFDDTWSPRVVAEINDYQVKIVHLQGEFVWHAHADTDELFMVLAGALDIHLRQAGQPAVVSLQPGELVVIPKGVEHKPAAQEPASVMLFEPNGVVNTGDADSDRRADNDVWV